MNITEGEQSDEVMLDSGKPINIPFKIKCDDFDVSFYESGMPKEFRSKIALIENGKEILKKTFL